MQQCAAVALSDGTATALALKIPIASGPARRLVVGDPSIQLFDTLIGATVSRMAAGEHLAHQDEILIDEATATALNQQIQLAKWRWSGRPASASQCRSIRWRPNPQSPISNLQSEIVRPWLLPAVYERHQAGLGDFLTELRPVVALFLRFGRIEYNRFGR